MSSLAATLNDMTPAAEAEWWYRTAGGTAGPVSAAELRRLSSDGPLGGDTLVWRKGFGDHWRRLVEALAPAEKVGPPLVDYGRWAKAFAAVEANPGKLQWSWLGVFGPLAYLCLGMWRKALVILTVAWLVQIVFAFADWDHGSQAHVKPLVPVLLFTAWRLKSDLYRHRVLGEVMWPALRFMTKGWICGPVAAAALVLLLVAGMGNPVDGMIRNVDGVWQVEGAADQVVFDVASGTKTITYGGHTRAVRLAKVDDDGDGIVFDGPAERGRRIAIRKHLSDDNTTYTLDLFEDGELLANLAFLKPN